MRIQASEKNNETLPYTSAQPHMVLLYYNPLVLDERSEYIFSWSGRSYFKALETFYFYFAADGGDYTFYVNYGNT